MFIMCYIYIGNCWVILKFFTLYLCLCGYLRNMIDSRHKTWTSQFPERLVLKCSHSVMMVAILGWEEMTFLMDKEIYTTLIGFQIHPG